MSSSGGVRLVLNYNKSVKEFLVPDLWFHSVTSVSEVVSKPSPSTAAGVGAWYRLMQLIASTFSLSASDIAQIAVSVAEDGGAEPAAGGPAAEDEFVVPITNDAELRKCFELASQRPNATSAAASASTTKTLKLFISHEPPSPEAAAAAKAAALNPPVIVRATSGTAAVDLIGSGGDDKADGSGLFPPTPTAGSNGTGDAGSHPSEQRRNSGGGKSQSNALPDGGGRTTLTGAISIADFALESDYFTLKSPPTTSSNAKPAAVAVPLPAPVLPTATASSAKGKSAAAPPTPAPAPETSAFLLTSDIKVLDDSHFPTNAANARSAGTGNTGGSSSTAKSAPVPSSASLPSSTRKPGTVAPFILPHSSSAVAHTAPGLFISLPNLPLALIPPQIANARFIPSSKTLPDGTLVRAGAPVVQSWTFRNTGSKSWPVGTRLVYCHGNVHETPFPPVSIPAINPLQQVTIALTVHLPANAVGRFWGIYRLQAATRVGDSADTDSCRFGDSVWIDVQVQTPTEAQRTAQSGAGQQKKIGIEVAPPPSASPASAPRHTSSYASSGSSSHNNPSYQHQQSRNSAAASSVLNSYSFLPGFDHAGIGGNWL